MEPRLSVGVTVSALAVEGVLVLLARAGSWPAMAGAVLVPCALLTTAWWRNW